MTPQASAKSLVESFYAILDLHEPDRLRDICAPDLVGHGGAGADIDELIANTRGFLASFPDLGAAEMRHLVCEGEIVATWVSWAGTQDGDFAGVPASGRRVQFLGWDLFRVRDGQLIEITRHCDLFAILHQIGALPTAAPT